jgi:N-acetylglucosaminyldiphosphoundecaprenol N-acetyl-beta-D-mannosaminyltransferase
LLRSGVRFPSGPPDSIKPKFGLMFSVAGIPVANLSVEGALQRIRSLLMSYGNHFVVTANPEILVQAYKDKKYKIALQKANLILADGVGVVMASYLTKDRITQGRVTGVDLVERLISESTKYGYSLFLGGSTLNVLQKATHNLFYKYGKINIAGMSDSIRFKSLDDIDNNNSLEFVKQINSSKADILLLALGHPKQELWIANNLGLLNTKVCIGVGGSFDYLSNDVKRANTIVRLLGLEWLTRLVRQPSRVLRIMNAVFVFPCMFLFERLCSLFHVEH